MPNGRERRSGLARAGPPSRFWAAAGSILLLAVSVGAALLAAEFLVRAVAPQQLILVRPDIWRPADTIGWKHRPRVDTRVNTGERTVRFVTDDRGFRVAPSGPAEGEKKILLLGDSYMAALQVEYAMSFAGLLESELAPALGTSVAVRNAAVGGWDAGHYLIRARELLEREGGYDLVIVGVYLGNDLIEERPEEFEPRRPAERYSLRLPAELSAEEMIESVARPVNDWLEVRSHLFVLTKNMMENMLMRLGLTARYIPPELRVDRADSSAWNVTAEALSDLHELVRARGIPALFVLIPSHYQVDPELLREHASALGIDPAMLDPGQPNRLLGDRLRRNDVPLLDLLPTFRQAAGEGVQLYGEVDPHFSPAGHEAMWRAARERVTSAVARPATVLEKTGDRTVGSERRAVDEAPSEDSRAQGRPNQES